MSAPAVQVLLEAGTLPVYLPAAGAGLSSELLQLKRENDKMELLGDEIINI